MKARRNLSSMRQIREKIIGTNDQYEKEFWMNSCSEKGCWSKKEVDLLKITQYQLVVE
jgi:hypothetical protein